MVWRRCFFSLVVIALIMCQQSFGMVEDNRFFPEYPRNYSRTWQRPSAVFFDGMIMAGHKAFDPDDDEKKIGMFTVFGKYNQNQLVEAISDVGLPNPYTFFPLLSRFQNEEIIWNMKGKLQTQGVAFQWDQNLWCYLWMGGSAFFMHLYSRNLFELNKKTITALTITPDDAMRLDEMRRFMNDQLGIQSAVYDTTGFSDIDFYLRVGNIWDYLCKFRRIDAGLKVGIMVPTGLERKAINPASLPFGGDGHWGIYTSADVEFELKEDWKAGMHVRVNKRFAKTKTERMPVVGEQQLYGAVQGPARINPGVTFIVAPYARLENIREGFGLQIGYTVAHHMKDHWTDQRAVQNPPVNLSENNEKSTWTAEFVTVDAFFDLAQFCLPHWYIPLVSFKWDVPIRFFASKGATKTNRVMLGIELNY